MTLDSLDLPKYVAARLARYGYGTVDDLAAATPSHLLHLPELGPHRVASIVEALGKVGYSLSDAPEPEPDDEHLDPHPLAEPVADAHELGASVRQLADDIGVPAAAVKGWLVGCTPADAHVERITAWAAHPHAVRR